VFALVSAKAASEVGPNVLREIHRNKAMFDTANHSQLTLALPSPLSNIAIRGLYLAQ